MLHALLCRLKEQKEQKHSLTNSTPWRVAIGLMMPPLKHGVSQPPTLISMQRMTINANAQNQTFQDTSAWTVGLMECGEVFSLVLVMMEDIVLMVTTTKIRVFHTHTH